VCLGNCASATPGERKTNSTIDESPFAHVGDHVEMTLNLRWNLSTFLSWDKYIASCGSNIHVWHVASRRRDTGHIVAITRRASSNVASRLEGSNAASRKAGIIEVVPDRYGRIDVTALHLDHGHERREQR
jgi:endonuclease/exonuclease/phosphatase family metal-dependent hydrolase